MLIPFVSSTKVISHSKARPEKSRRKEANVQETNIQEANVQEATIREANIQEPNEKTKEYHESISRVREDI